MDEKARYGIRRGAVELTRRQWILFVSVLSLGVATGIVLIVTVSTAAGSIALGLTAVADALILGFGRHAQSTRD